MKYTIEIITHNKDIPYSLLLLADETIDAINKYIYDCVVAIIKSKKSGQLLGVIALYPVSSIALEIKNIAVSNRYQKKGIGSLLMSFASTYAINNSYKELKVGTGDYSLDALAFYEKVGFKKDYLIEDFFITNYKDPIIENGHQLRDMVVLKKNLY